MRRLAQFFAALTASISVDEHILLATFLEPAEQRLFERMPLFDRRHCLDVHHTLVKAGHTSIALRKAALLHDCGKVDNQGQPMPLPYYGIFVILKAIAPQLYWNAVYSPNPLFERFAIHATHDERSARLVQAVGGDPELITILHDYGANCELATTRLLAWADEQN